MRSATRSAVSRYCDILWTPSAKRSTVGSREAERWVRRDWRDVEDVNVNVEDRGAGEAVGSSLEVEVSGGCDCSAVSIAVCEGSRREGSICGKSGSSALFGLGGDLEGRGGGGIVFNFEDAVRASHAAFSSWRLSNGQQIVGHVDALEFNESPCTYRLISCSNSCSIDAFLSFCGFGFLINTEGAVSSCLRY